MRGRKTKGKQKINIQRIEKNEDRLVTFSKRRSGIYTKLSELSVLSGVDVGFLVKSGSGKLYTYGNPSFEAVAKRFLNGDDPEGSSSSSSSIIDAHIKLKMEEQCKAYNDLVEKVDAEEERVLMMAKTALPMDSDAWWNTDPMNDDEDAMWLLTKFEGLYEKLCEIVEGKTHRRNDTSTSQVNNNNRHG